MDTLLNSNNLMLFFGLASLTGLASWLHIPHRRRKTIVREELAKLHTGDPADLERLRWNAMKNPRIIPPSKKNTSWQIHFDEYGYKSIAVGATLRQALDSFILACW